MSDLFQEHKKFIISYAVGGLAFAVLWMIANALYSGDIQRLNRGIQKHRLDQSKAVSQQLLLKAQQDARRVESSTAALVKAIDRIPGRIAFPDQVPDSGELMLAEGQQSPDIYFTKVREQIRADEVERCAIRNIDIDQDLGLPESFPTTRREFDWYLRGLDVVEQFLELVLGVEEGSIARVDRIEMQPAPKSRPASGATPYLEDHKVTFVVVGYPKGIYALIESFARKREDGRFLEVASAEIRSLDAPPGSAVGGAKGRDPSDQDRVEAKLELVAVEVNPDGRIERPGRTGR